MLLAKLQSWPARFFDPAFRPELIRRLKRQAANAVGRDKSALKSTEWCEKHAVSTEDALKMLGMTKEDLSGADIQTKLKAAEDRVQKHLQRHYIGPANLELLYTICKHQKPAKVLETGVAHGWSSLIILLAIDESAQLISNDLPPTYSFQEDYVGIAVPDKFRSNWDLRRSADREGLLKIEAEGHRFDIAHYDSDKTYNGRIFGYNKMWDLLNNGGILISDDIVDNHAFKDFCESKQLKPIIIRDTDNSKFEGIVVKAN